MNNQPTRMRQVRRISQPRPTSEQLRRRWTDARTHLWMFRFIAPLSIAILTVLGFTAPDELVAFFMWAFAIMLTLAFVVTDSIQQEDVRIARAAWLCSRLGIPQD